MKLRLVPPRQGALWVRQGFRMLLRQPVAYTALFFLFVFAAFVLASLPGLGMPALLVLMPSISLGFMIATQTALDGRTPLPSVFLAPFRQDRQRRRAQLQLGLGYAVASALVILLAHWLDGGKLAEMQQEASTPGSAETVESTVLFFWMLMRLVLTLPVALLFWHAPALIHWGGAGAAQSVFFSTVACWRNRGAFAVYFLCWGGLLTLFMLSLSTLVVVFGLPQAITLNLMPPAVLLFSAAFYASLFFTFTDCFEPDAPQAGSA